MGPLRRSDDGAPARLLAGRSRLWDNSGRTGTAALRPSDDTVVADGGPAGGAVPSSTTAQLALSADLPGRVLRLTGRLDVTAAADARLALARAVGAGTGDLVLDLSGVTTFDATGLGVLVGAHRAADRTGRRLVLQDASPQVHRLLRLTRLYRVLRTVASSDCA